MKITLIYGSVRTGRKGIRAVRYLEQRFKENEHDTVVIDPVKDSLPLLDYMYKEYDEGEAPANMEKIAARLKESDAFVIVSGEYNHGIPPALKNTLDHFQTEYFFKPAGIATYSAGAFGGVRAGQQLRSVLGELGMPTISTMLAFPGVSKLFDESGTLQNDKPEKKVKQFIDELEFYAKALKAERSKGTPF